MPGRFSACDPTALKDPFPDPWLQKLGDSAAARANALAPSVGIVPPARRTSSSVVVSVAAVVTVADEENSWVPSGA
jgi:hypothetical protein